MAVITGADHHISVVGAGKNKGTWDEFEGGDTSGNAGTYRPSGGKQRRLRGKKTTEPVTVRVGYDPVTINKQEYRNEIGQDYSVTIRARDANGNPSYEIDTFTGLLDEVHVPGSGAETDDNDPAMFEIVIAAHEK